MRGGLDRSSGALTRPWGASLKDSANTAFGTLDDPLSAFNRSFLHLDPAIQFLDLDKKGQSTPTKCLAFTDRGPIHTGCRTKAEQLSLNGFEFSGPPVSPLTKLS